MLKNAKKKLPQKLTEGGRASVRSVTRLSIRSVARLLSALPLPLLRLPLKTWKKHGGLWKNLEKHGEPGENLEKHYEKPGNWALRFTCLLLPSPSTEMLNILPWARPRSDFYLISDKNQIKIRWKSDENSDRHSRPCFEFRSDFWRLIWFSSDFYQKSDKNQIGPVRS